MRRKIDESNSTAKKIYNTKSMGEELFEDKSFMSLLEKKILECINENQSSRKHLQAAEGDRITTAHSSQMDNHHEYQFEFEKKSNSKYPWSVGENYDSSKTVESNLLIQQIAGSMDEIIQDSLTTILNKEFINVTQQILAMREEISEFTKEEYRRTEEIKQEFSRQIQSINKKLLQQQHVSSSINAPIERFSRSKAVFTNHFNADQKNDSLNSSVLSTNSKIGKKAQSEQQEQALLKKSLHHEVLAMKKDIQSLQKGNNSKQSCSKEELKHLQERIWITEEKLSEMSIEIKTKLEETRHKLNKSHELLLSEVRKESSKEFIKEQIARKIKSSLKIYLDEILKCKNDIEDINDQMARNEKGMMDYVGNQLKNVWTLITGVKSRIETLEDQCKVSLNQSVVW